MKVGGGSVYDNNASGPRPSSKGEEEEKRKDCREYRD